jgi:methionyl-tRNA synthetase
VCGGFDTVGDLIGRHRQRAAIAEAMRVVGEVNKYLTATEPYKMKDDSQRERLGTVLHVAAQCVLDCNTLLAPFLPFSANQVWTTYGGKGEFMPMPRVNHVEDLDPDDGAGLDVYPIITGDYSQTPAWESRPVIVGTPIERPSPVFTKLDPAVVEEELARLA